MADHARPGSDATPPMIIGVLWVAFLVSHGIMGATFWMAGGMSDTPTPEVDPMVRTAIAALGVLVPLLSPLVTGLMARSVAQQAKEKALDNPVQLVFVPSIVRWAMCEIGAICGGVVLLLGDELLWWALPAAAGVLMHLLAFPSSSSIEQFRSQVRAARP